MLAGRFAVEPLPEVALAVVGGHRVAQAHNLHGGDFLEGYIVLHTVIVLSQSFDGVFEDREPGAEVPRFLPHLGEAYRQVAAKAFRIVVLREDLPDRRQPEPHRLEGLDLTRRLQLPCAVVAVAGEGIHRLGGQQTDLIVVAQHLDADHRQLGKFADLEHVTSSRLFLSSPSAYTIPQWESQ